MNYLFIQSTFLSQLHVVRVKLLLRLMLRHTMTSSVSIRMDLTSNLHPLYPIEGSVTAWPNG